MEVFQSIEEILETASAELNARLSKNRPGMPEPLRTFEERRIDWVDNEINKAIIIQPTFEKDGVNSDYWNFRIVAWKWIEGERKDFVEAYVTKKIFGEIEEKIDLLLDKAKKRLGEIQEEDLKRKTEHNTRLIFRSLGRLQ